MIKIKENELLKNHTTFRIGGPAGYFAVAQNYQDVKELIDWAKSKKINWTVIGGGSNLLVSDKGFDGLVIKIFGGRIKIDEGVVIANAGAPLSLVLNKSLQAGLSGLEWSVGIPGTIGGAIFGNIGAYGHEMSEVVKEVTILRGDEAMALDPEDCGFAYRQSMFGREDSHDIILSVRLKLAKISPAQVAEAQKRIKEILSDRSRKFYGASAGCFFKNVTLSLEEIERVKRDHPELPEEFVKWQKIPAAWLIEQCELKGKAIGGAKVSETHAGIIVNTGTATAENIIMLASIIKQKVRSRFNLQLHEEVRYLGF